METKIIKAGWVEKRSQYLKKWRRRWLVLSVEFLCTYKTDVDLSKPTMEIPVSEITDACPTSSEAPNENSFTISTAHEKYTMRTANDSDLCAWLNLIGQLRSGTRVSSFGSPNYYHESKVLSDESLITSFTRMKEQLYNREEELLKELDEIYKVYVDKATQEFKEISEIYDAETENSQIVVSILDSRDEGINKIRNIQNAAKSALNFKDLETYNISKLQVSIQEDNLDKLVKNNIKVCLGNPSEVMIRRTNITRALKWRYTGERIDAITFSVNKDVKLTAVGVCTPYKLNRTTFIKEFCLLKGGTTNSNAVYRHSQRVSMQYNPEVSTCKVNMETHVLLKRDSKYTVQFLIEGAHTYKCVDCLANVEGPDRTIWTFVNTLFSQNHQSNRCDTVCGPIADFYFMVV